MSVPASIALRGLSVVRGGRQLLAPVDLDLRGGECLGLIGPNGAGKSTLIRAAMGLEPAAGQSSLAAMPAAARARLAAYLPQSREVAWPVSVRALVALGRLPHLHQTSRLGPDDRHAVDDALARLGLTALAGRDATRLSGGETARVLLARTVAQQTPFLLADEPVAGLDPAHQIGAMRLLADLAGRGRGVLVTCHDLGLAARFCTRLAVMDHGRLVADGPPGEVLNAALLAAVFGITARVEHRPEGIVVIPLDTLAARARPGQACIPQRPAAPRGAPAGVGASGCITGGKDRGNMP